MDNVEYLRRQGFAVDARVYGYETKRYEYHLEMHGTSFYLTCKGKKQLSIFVSGFLTGKNLGDLKSHYPKKEGE